MPGIVTIESFGGGTSMADNTAALNAANSSLSGLGGGRIDFGPGTYNFTGFPATLAAGVTLNGVGPSTRLKLTSTSSGSFLAWSGSGIQSYTLAAAIAKGDRTAQLSTSAGITVGMLLYFERTRPQTTGSGSYTETYSVCLRVYSITGSVVRLNGRFPFDIALSDSPISIYTVALAEGGGLTNITLDGYAASGAVVRGANPVMTQHQFFDQVRFEGWASGGSDGSGLYMYLGYENVVGNVGTLYSGSASSSDVMIYRQTDLRISSIRADQPLFGPQLAFCSYASVGRLLVTGSAARGIKLQGCARCIVNSAIADNSASTGFGITIGTIDSVVSALNITKDKDAPSNSDGLWFSDQLNTGNVVGNLRTDSADTWDVYVGTSDTNCVVEQVWGASIALKIYNMGNAFFGGINGRQYLPVQGNQLGSASGSYGSPTTSNTNILLYSISPTNWSGIGCTTGGEIYMVAGLSAPSTKLLISPQPVPSYSTSLFLEYDDGGTLVFNRVSVGPADSAGTGFRTLRVPN